MLGNVGTSELLLIFLVSLLVFGAKRLPEIARGLGQGIREFRTALHEVTREIQQPVGVPPRPVPVRPAPVEEVAPSPAVPAAVPAAEEQRAA